jgi:hypothetical protein
VGGVVGGGGVGGGGGGGDGGWGGGGDIDTGTCIKFNTTKYP